MGGREVKDSPEGGLLRGEGRRHNGEGRGEGEQEGRRKGEQRRGGGGGGCSVSSSSEEALDGRGGDCW